MQSSPICLNNASPAEHRCSWSLAATHLGSRLGLQLLLAARERLQAIQQGSLCQWEGWYHQLHLPQAWQMAWSSLGLVVADWRLATMVLL